MADKTTNLQLQKIADTDYAGNFPTIYNNNLDLIDVLNNKQDKLIAGSGITIASDGKTISSSGKKWVKCKLSDILSISGNILTIKPYHIDYIQESGLSVSNVEILTEYKVPLSKNGSDAYQIGSTKGNIYFADTYIQLYYTNRVIQSRTLYYNGSGYDLTLSDNNIYEYNGEVFGTTAGHPWYSIYKLE